MVYSPPLYGMSFTWPSPEATAPHEFVVPRSMPMIVSGGSRSIRREGTTARGAGWSSRPTSVTMGGGKGDPEVCLGRAPLALDRGDGREGRLRREPIAPVVRGVPAGLPRGAPPAGALVGAIPPRRPRPLRLRGARDAGRARPALDGVRSPVRSRRRGAPRRRAGGGPGRPVPRDR